MDDSYCLLPERISEQFSEIDSDIVMDLRLPAGIYRVEGPDGGTETPNLVIGALLEARENFFYR